MDFRQALTIKENDIGGLASRQKQHSVCMRCALRRRQKRLVNRPVHCG
jgi:hypothetical protein